MVDDHWERGPFKYIVMPHVPSDILYRSVEQSLFEITGEKNLLENCAVPSPSPVRGE